MHGKRCLFILKLTFFAATQLYSQNNAVKFHHQIDLSHLYTTDAAFFNALSVSTENKYYLVDVGQNRILHTDSLAQLLNEVGGFGWELEQFDWPVDIWAENSLDVFVADYNNSRVQRFDRHLNFVTAIIGEKVENESKQFAFPVAVAWSSFGDLFIIESELNRIIQFDELGVATLSFGDYGEGAGQLEAPAALCVSGKNEIFVVDQGRISVLKYDYYGNFLQEFAFHSLSKPVAISSHHGLIFVLDGMENRIIVAAENGKELFRFSPIPVENRKKKPQLTDLCTQKNRLYILDNTRRRIDVYTVVMDDK
ncbi:MAG: hypothetical protein DWQ05_21085 [Calditrichaeota bacterium]|nr:MAG: hypothetical protein DWQ05_21085 [Calditrichota bacterium]